MDLYEYGLVGVWQESFFVFLARQEGGLFDDEFEGGVAFLPGCVVAVADADEAVAVLALVALGAVLAGDEGFVHFHVGLPYAEIRSTV